MTNTQFDLLVELIRTLIKDEADKYNFYGEEINEIRQALVTEEESVLCPNCQAILGPENLDNGDKTCQSCNPSNL